MSERLKCDAVVWKRDTYRVNRDGTKRKFKMHYSRCRCSRWAVEGPLCRQHANMIGVVMLWTRRDA